MSHRAFDGYTSTQTANGVDGYDTTIRAQSATGTGSKGGNLILSSGEGTDADGYIALRAGTVDILTVTSDGLSLDGYLNLGENLIVDGYLSVGNHIDILDGYLKVDGYTTIDGYEIIFDGYAEAPFIKQLEMPTPGIDGYHLTIQAQSSTTDPARGGDIVIKSGDGYNGDGYIRDGYIKLYSGSNEVARIVPNKFYTITGQRFNLSDVGTTPFTLTDGYFAAMVDTGIAITIDLPTEPHKGDSYYIKDSTGTAGANNITVSGNGHNIDGAANKTITTNYGAILVTYSGTQWNILSALGTIT